jgi:peptidyl-prolyl cis-trans isomerase B (cyclophilin B)
MTDPTPPAPNYQPAQPYAQPAYATDAYGRPIARTNTLAIVSLVLSLVGVSLGGIICGHIALGQIKRTGEQGHGLALAGLIVGYVFAALTVLFVIVYILIIVFTIGAVGLTGASFS